MPSSLLQELDREAILRLRERARTPLPSPEELKAIRKRAGVSAQDLADVLGISASSIYGWEQGIRRPSRSLRTRYFQALEILRGADE